MAQIRIRGGDSVLLNKPVPAPSSRGANWNHEETQLLVDVWSGEKGHYLTAGEAGPDAYLTNRAIYAKADKRLRQMGYERSKAQIGFKLKQLKAKYKGIVMDRQGPGRLAGRHGPAQWEFFEQIDGIFRRSKMAARTSASTEGAGTSEAPGTSLSQGKRSPGKSKSTAPSTASSFRARATNSASQPPPTPSAVKAALAARPQAAETPELLLPEVPESDYDENEDDDEEDGTEDLEETDGNDMQDFFGRNQSQEAEDDLPAEMPSNHDKITEPGHSSYNPTAATNLAKTSKRPTSSQRNPGQPRGRPKAPSGPPRDDLTVAQAITDAVQRFIDHQSHHLTEQHKLLQRYLKFERARMRWEMDMETRRMKWEEEREMREEERRQRQEELEAKRVSDNREFMLQMAVVLGNGESGAGKDSNSSKN